MNDCNACYAPITDDNQSIGVPTYLSETYHYKADNVPAAYRAWVAGGEGCQECGLEAVQAIALEWVRDGWLEDASRLIAEHLGLGVAA
jgi:hypothetical protein